MENRLIAEPRDVELLIGLKQKHGSEEKAIAILKDLREQRRISQGAFRDR